jgi:HEPN domain-containing protein
VRDFPLISHKAHEAHEGIRATSKPSANPLCPLCLCAKLFFFNHGVTRSFTEEYAQPAKRKTLCAFVRDRLGGGSIWKRLAYQVEFTKAVTFSQMVWYTRTMTNEEKYEYWLDIAEYDLKTAETMLSGGRWLYVVFMCQQAIEKLVKGLYTLYIDDNVPKIHDINSVFTKFEGKLPVPVDDTTRKLFAKLSAFYLNNRYPEFKAKLSTILNESEAKITLKQSQEVFAWLLTLKP